MAAKKSISQIEQIENVSQDDLVLISHASGDSYQSYAAKISSIVPDVSEKEDVSNKVTTILSSSTDEQYPSAKCVWDIVGDVESALAAINGTAQTSQSGNGGSWT